MQDPGQPDPLQRAMDLVPASGGLVDASGLLELRRLQQPGRPDAVGRILDRFFQESQERLETMRRAVESDDAPELLRAAHALKGIAGTVGANEVLDLAVRLEHIGRERRTQDCAKLVADLDAALARARPIFDRILNASSQ
jgi:HPt (histidine-containing phosphotransfer) domain-containing protein